MEQIAVNYLLINKIDLQDEKNIKQSPVNNS